MGGDRFPHEGGCSFGILGVVLLDLIIRAPWAHTPYEGELPWCQRQVCKGRKPGVVVHSCDSRAWKAEAEGPPQIWGQLGLHSEVLSQKSKTVKLKQYNEMITKGMYETRLRELSPGELTADHAEPDPSPPWCWGHQNSESIPTDPMSALWLCIVTAWMRPPFWSNLEVKWINMKKSFRCGCASAVRGLIYSMCKTLGFGS